MVIIDYLINNKRTNENDDEVKCKPNMKRWLTIRINRCIVLFA